MNKRMKKELLIAASLVVIGLLMFASVMTIYGWDFRKLNTEKFVTDTYTISEKFDRILLDTDTVDVQILPSEDEDCKVVCYLQETVETAVKVQSDTLRIQAKDERAWYERIGFHFISAEITVFLPEDEYLKFNVHTNTGDVIVEELSAEILEISVSTGDITVTDGTFEEVDMKVSTGDIHVTDLKCSGFNSEGSTGDISLHQVVADQRITIERHTGDVVFDSSDAPVLRVKTDTGDVTGTLLSGKQFITQTDTGSVDIPDSTDGGKCEIETDTGDISICIQQRNK